MVASNELNPDYFAETARIVFDMAREIENEIGISFHSLISEEELAFPIDQKKTG